MPSSILSTALCSNFDGFLIVQVEDLDLVWLLDGPSEESWTSTKEGPMEDPKMEEEPEKDLRTEEEPKEDPKQ